MNNGGNISLLGIFSGEQAIALTLTKEQAAGLDTRMAQSRHDWEHTTVLLADDVQTWASQEAAARGWRVEREEQERAEDVVGGAYRVPVVTIHAPQGRLILEPIARGTLGAQGRVDLHAWPSLFRVMLLHRPRGKDRPLEWVVRTESGLDWPQLWNRETFLTLAEGAAERLVSCQRLRVIAENYMAVRSFTPTARRGPPFPSPTLGAP